MNRDEASRWVLHDYLQVNGGAERLVVLLARNLPDCRLGVSGIYPDFSIAGNLQGLSPRVLSSGFDWLPRIPRAILTFSRAGLPSENADCVIYSGIYAPLAAARQVRGKKIYYCHTPPRFAFDREDQYVDGANVCVRPVLRQAIERYRCAYLSQVGRMDAVITNSLHVRSRLRAWTGVDATVIHPPVDTTVFRFLGQQDYYLSVARLEPNKRVELVVRAFLTMPDKNLVVASGGSELAALKALARGAPNIRFAGWLDDNEIARLIGDAIAVIYVPGDEDFGMSAVEAMAAGKPVIGVDEGGLRESILDGRTGILLPPGLTHEKIAGAVMQLTPTVAEGMRPACEMRARDFSLARFISAFQEVIS